MFRSRYRVVRKHSFHALSQQQFNIHIYSTLFPLSTTSINLSSHADASRRPYPWHRSIRMHFPPWPSRHKAGEMIMLSRTLACLDHVKYHNCRRINERQSLRVHLDRLPANTHVSQMPNVAVTPSLLKCQSQKTLLEFEKECSQKLIKRWQSSIIRAFLCPSPTLDPPMVEHDQTLP